MELQPCRGSRNWCYTAIGSGATITAAGILSVNGAKTIDGASTLSGTVAIGRATQTRVTIPCIAPAKDIKKASRTVTLLSMASTSKNQADIRRMLLDQRADADKSSKDGFTPLYCARQEG